MPDDCYKRPDGGYHIENDGGSTMNDNQNKPPYRVPSMAEIVAVPWNGMKVASTFSGCGGSCLGYRMAGFRVVWANEFVPIAQESYKANADPGCILDGRDIKLVKPEEILEATGLRVGELDIFDGSPPCQAFSTAGKREKGWGKEKSYEHGAKQCNETLFDEYVRLLRGLKPRAFIAENVSGLVKGTAKGYFLEILAALKASGYRVTCRVLDAQWLGVPQSRSRTIFVGIREDLGINPVHPLPLPYRYSVRDALPWLDSVESGPTGFGVGSLRPDTPAPAILASMQSPYAAHKVTAIHDESGRWSKGDITDLPSPTIRASRAGTLNVQTIVGNHRFKPRFGDPASGPSPTIMAGGPCGSSGQVRVVAGSFDNFKKKRDVSDRPCPAILAGQPIHYLVENDGPDRPAKEMISARVGHGFKRVSIEANGQINTICAKGTETSDFKIGAQQRKFTIAEVKRLCAFPDDFVLVGSYAQQWERLGNSVPPVMMFHIAKTLAKSLSANRQKTRRSARNR